MAVFTPVSEADCRAFLSDYDIGELVSFKGIAEGIENSNFLLTLRQNEKETRYILTLFEKRTPEADLPFFVALMDGLARQDMPCPQPIRDRNGDALQRLNGKPALMVSFLEGKQPSVIAEDHCRQLGLAMAAMHKAGAAIGKKRRNAMGIDAWAEMTKNLHGKANEIAPGMADMLEEELTYISTHWPAHAPKAIIHADLFPDNVFFRDGALSGIIDFYFACTDVRLYDLAICINAWCFDGEHHFLAKHSHALCQAYGNAMNIRTEEWQHLPVLCRAAALRFLLTRSIDRVFPPDDALVTAKDPGEYLAKLRFHQQVVDADYYRGAL